MGLPPVSPIRCKLKSILSHHWDSTDTNNDESCASVSCAIPHSGEQEQAPEVSSRTILIQLSKLKPILISILNLARYHKQLARTESLNCVMHLRYNNLLCVLINLIVLV